MPVSTTVGSQTGQQTAQQQSTQAGQQTGSSLTSALTPAATASENLAAGGDLASLSNLINSINQGAQQSANISRLPGGAALQAQSSGIIGNLLSGQLDPGTIAMLQQQGAESGAASGLGAGSGATNAAYLKALGLTSQQQEQTGLSDLNAALAANPAAPIFNQNPYLVTPSSAGTTTTTSGQQTGQQAGTSAGQQAGQQAQTTVSSEPAGISMPQAGANTPSTPAVDNSWWNSLFPSGGGTTATSTYTGGYPTYNPATGTFTNPASGAAVSPAGGGLMDIGGGYAIDSNGNIYDPAGQLIGGETPGSGVAMPAGTQEALGGATFNPDFSGGYGYGGYGYGYGGLGDLYGVSYGG